MSLDVYLKCECCWGILYEANITHNLGTMAEQAGIYRAMWRPEEIGITRAKQLIEPLQAALWLMERDPDFFKRFNVRNGRGLYKHFVPWLKGYLEACIRYPEALVEVSR